VASITASGGTTSYTYLWSNGGTTSAITGLLAGAYTATVTDANSCTSIKAATVTQPSALATATAVTNVSCNSGSNGVASITASGGTTSYTYLWSNGGTTSAITGLLAGVYTATVTDANSCTSIKAATVTQPSALVTTTAVTNVACNGGSNGVASINASGGTTSYTYLWSNGGTTSAITGLLAGVYTATVTDANSCTSIKAATVTQPSSIASTITSTNTGCAINSGAASVVASGGTGVYTYSWSPSGGTGATATSLGIGTYSCLIKDANLCALTKTISITTSGAPTATVTSVSHVTCNSLCNGTASVSASGGSAPYTYLWSNGNAIVNATGLCAGVYNCTVTGNNGCAVVVTATITEPTILVANSTSSSILCNGGMSTVNVTATGGTPSYLGLGTFTALAGTHTYTVTDANGCSATTSVSISEPIILGANATATPILCNGGMSTINVTATDGTPSYSGVGTFTAMAGVQSFTVTDANGCSATTSISISEPSVLVANATASSIICNGGISTINVTANGGITYYTGVGTFTALAGTQTYTVTDANGCTATTSVSITEPAVITSAQSFTLCQGQFVTVATSTYSAAGTFTDVIASLINGCDSTITTDIMINILPTVSVNNGTICAGQSFTMTPNGAVTYTYSNGSDVAVPTVDATYTVTGTDANGCENTATSSVTVNTLPILMVSTTNTLMCSGETATLSVTGATSYTWSTTETTADIAVSPTTQTTYTVDGTDGNGCSNVTTFTQDVSLCTGIAQASNASAVMLSVYPNPNHGSFTVKSDIDMELQVINALGQVIQVIQLNFSNDHQVMVDVVENGIYFITGQTTHLSVKQKVIVTQ
ncbi:MAG: T9SS type A sorting domain-containing protein, partial [Bacteroidota bacterium]